VLGYFGRDIPQEQLRQDCGVSRDGSKASNVVKAARAHGLTAAGWRKEPADLLEVKPPFIVFWNMNHFLVVEGFGKDHVLLNDPAAGRRKVTWQEFMSTSMVGLQSIETIKSNAGETDFFSKWSGHHAKLLNASQYLASSSMFLYSIPMVLNQVNSAVMICLRGIRVMDGILTIGSLITFQASMTSFTAPVMALMGMSGQIQEMKGTVTRLDDVLRNPVDPQLTIILRRSHASKASPGWMVSSSYATSPSATANLSRR
jgi:ABC-type bacteriocin/lantibiotic exporter with double-glycine peptidase domain